VSPKAMTTGCTQKLQYRCLHPSQLPERERKKTKKTGQRRRKKRKKSRKNEKTKNQQGLPFGLCFHFLHIKSAEQGGRKFRKPV